MHSPDPVRWRRGAAHQRALGAGRPHRPAGRAGAVPMACGSCGQHKDTCLLAAAASRRRPRCECAAQAVQQEDTRPRTIAVTCRGAGAKQPARRANQVAITVSCSAAKACIRRAWLSRCAITAIQAYFRLEPAAAATLPALAQFSGARAGLAAAKRVNATQRTHRQPASACKCGPAQRPPATAAQRPPGAAGARFRSRTAARMAGSC